MIEALRMSEVPMYKKKYRRNFPRPKLGYELPSIPRVMRFAMSWLDEDCVTFLMTTDV